MRKEIKIAFYKGYRIVVFINETSNDGKYYAEARLFMGQANSLEDACKLPTYNLFGGDPDKLIEEVKEKMNNDFQE